MTVNSNDLISVPVIAEALEAMLSDARRFVREGHAIDPIVALFTISEDGKELSNGRLVDVRPFMGDSMGRAAIAYAMDRAMDDPESPINALILMEPSTMRIRPLDEPDKTLTDPEECLLVVLRRPGLSQSLVYRVDREVKTVEQFLPGEPSEAYGGITGVDGPDE